jgi:PAS domain S-box-containing protein
VNRAFSELVGRAQEELVDRPIYEVVHPEYREIVRKRVEGINEKGGRVPMIEEKFIRPDGQAVEVEVNTSPIVLQGRPASVTYVHDITRRKGFQRALAESEEKFRAIFELADDAIFVADAVTGRIVDCNRKAEGLIGRARDEIIGMRQADLHPPGLGERYVGHFREYLATGKVAPEQMYAYRKDGTEVPIKISASSLRFGGRAYVAGVFRDVTLEIEAAEQMRKRNQELEQFAKLTTGRELRMLELKKENEALRKLVEGRKGK